jgi:EmrB/QacA subfamily drug resistance transporter
MTDATASPGPSFLATRAGKLTLAFVCVVGLLDFLDTSIVNVALPSIQRDLHFTQQSLQWVLSGYTVTYGGFLLLGGRLADLLGRRSVLVAGTALFAVSSLAGGLSQDSGTLIGARLAQGLGAALMSPAALSILTTSFATGTDRVRALGAWGAMGGIASVFGVFLGGLLSAGPGWRWVLFINPPICAAVIAAAYRLISPRGAHGEARERPRLASFDTPGALLGTGGMLLLIYALVKAPVSGWGSAATIGELIGAGALLTLFVGNEARHREPLVPLSIFRIKGLAAADATQVLAIAGFYSVFFFVTLYMQDVLHFSALRAGAAYVPVAVIVAVGAGGSSGLISRIGTRPLIVAGALVAAGGIAWVSRIPAHGYYWTGIFPAMMVMGIGLGAVFVGVQTAANAGVPADKAGLAGALINASFQVGGALGLAIFSALATARTRELLAAHAPAPAALAGGYARALLASAIFVAAAAVIGLRTANTKGEPAAEITAVAVDDAVRLSTAPGTAATAAGGPARRPSGRSRQDRPLR